MVLWKEQAIVKSLGMLVVFQQYFSLSWPPSLSPGDSNLSFAVLISLKGAGQAIEEEIKTTTTI